MAGPLDPFNPGEDNSPFGGIDPQAFTRVRQEWDSFLGNPQGRAALLSAGLSLMQPPSFGDTGASQIARAIGAGGESATRNEAMDLKKSEAMSKDESRAVASEAKMLNAETRASAADARTGAAGSRMELQSERLRNQTERAQMANKVRLSIAYQNYVKEVAKRNDPIALSMRGKDAIPEPVLPIGDWVKANPMLRNLGLTDETTNPDDNTVVPASADTTSKPTTTRSPQDMQALEWANANPNDPRAIVIKKRLGVQ